MRLEDVGAADLMLRAAFASTVSTRPRLERYLAIEPEGWFCAEADGALVGTVGAFRYGRFGHIGLMAVLPGLQRGGYGRRLLEHALAWLGTHGIQTAILDATPEGEPMYERFGFADAGRAVELVGQGAGATEVDVAPGSLDEVVALDADLFGAERRAMWTRLFAERPDGTLVTRDGGGAIAGYAHLQPELLGPFGARDASAARTLLAAAPARPLRAQVPGDNAEGVEILRALGFRDLRAPRHLVRGDATVAPTWRRIWGKGSFCLA
jgi:GNAT superfamily N-acetyltransferase